MITKETMLQMAKRNINKAQIAMTNNYDRKGITELERENLISNVEYTQMVYDLIEKYIWWSKGGNYNDSWKY